MEGSSQFNVGLSWRSSILVLVSAASSGIHQRLVRRRETNESKGNNTGAQHQELIPLSKNEKNSPKMSQQESSLQPTVQRHFHQHTRPAPLVPSVSTTPTVWEKYDGNSSESSNCDEATSSSSTSTSSEELPTSCPGTPIHRSPVPYFLPASVTKSVAIGVTVGMIVAWLMCTGWRLRMRAIFQALSFALIEFHFTGLTDNRAKRYWPPACVGAWKRSGMIALEKIAHALHISLSSVPAPVTRIWRTGYTTWEMFGASLLWNPIFSELYFRFFFAGDSWLCWGCRVLFYPANVWLMEMVVGYFLSRVWGRRAWWYKDTWARFDGNITLGYGHYWLVMGVVHNASFFALELPLTEAIGEWLGVA